jgi:hypothetical protein
MQVGAHVCMCTWVCRSEVRCRCHFLGAAQLGLWDWVSHWPGAHPPHPHQLDWLAKKPQLPQCCDYKWPLPHLGFHCDYKQSPPHLVLWLQMAVTLLGFSHGSRVQIQAPMLVANIIVMEPSSQPLSQHYLMPLYCLWSGAQTTNLHKMEPAYSPIIPGLFSLSRWGQIPQHSTTMESCYHYWVYLARQC